MTAQLKGLWIVSKWILSVHGSLQLSRIYGNLQYGDGEPVPGCQLDSHGSSQPSMEDKAMSSAALLQGRHSPNGLFLVQVYGHAYNEVVGLLHS